MGLTVSSIMAESLTPVDVQELLERLDDLQSGASTRSVGRLGTAYKAFSSAIKSDEAAWDLYTKCVGKVRFEDEDRSSQEFREWKRRSEERLGEEFQRALRHELNWLLLTVEAAKDPKNVPDLGPKAMDKLDQMIKDLPEMGRHKERLDDSVLKSEFALTYGLGGIELKDWPLAPLKIEEVYEKLIFPPLRNPEGVEELRTAWVRRIKQEGDMTVPQEEGPGGRVKRSERSTKTELFVIERRPELLWAMEVDLFKAGDQRGAAVRMVEHIDKYLGHESEGKWIADFKQLIDPKPEEAVEE